MKKNLRVFISYSHDSQEKHVERVLAFAERLVQDGIDCILDRWEESPPEGWPKWMDRHIKNADFVIMICTKRYYRRVIGEEKKGKGLGIKWESTLAYNHIYQEDSENTRFIPVLFKSGKVEYIPTPLQGASRYSVETKQGYEELYRRLTGQHYPKKPKLGKIRELPKREIKQDFFEAEKFGPGKILDKLPTTNPDLFGREKELKVLNKAWDDPQTCILSLVAWGGVGKTALVNSWLNLMELDNYRGAEHVYGWSFYSQGAREDRQASADEFLSHALAWFGDPDPKEGSPWDKGVRLAGLIREQRILLILDGLEPLQYPPGEMQGQLKDKGMQALLKNLARSNDGLCIVTTRVSVEDIKHITRPFLIVKNLEKLSTEAGAALLQNLGVNGTAAELKKTSDVFAGHALALNLLGRYLAVVHKGDIRKRDRVPKLTMEEKEGGHARRVMESYERWLKDRPELRILYIMGLFDRPVEGGAIKALREEPPIDGLTYELQKLSQAKWKYSLKHLRDLRLLEPEDKNRPETLDCHPLVREHFGEKLKANLPVAWKEAHSRLYEYYKELPSKQQPDTLEEMQPLFAAAAHGCRAGRHQETMDKVYYSRITRSGNKDYCCKILGAWGADLAALSGFFEVLWHKPASGLTESYRAWVLNSAGYSLRALGRLGEAAQPMEAGLNAHIRQKDWKNAAVTADNLSVLYLTMGEINQAVEYGRQSVEFADRSGDDFERFSDRTDLANALHQAGEESEAEALFIEAEDMQKKYQPEYLVLYSVQCFWFCDLLLSRGCYQEVQERASYTIEIAKRNRWLLDIALDKLSLGRACLLQALKEETGDFAKAAEYMNQAVEGLRKAGTQHHLPRGLLARVALYRWQKEFSRAWEDLEEAREIAERGGMKLHLADYQLEAGRLHKDQKQKAKAREHLKTAKKMVEEMGYHRRDREVEELEKQL